MAEEEQNENPIKKGKEGGRPPVLDEKKQRQLVALLAHGISRRGAARVVGLADGHPRGLVAPPQPPPE